MPRGRPRGSGRGGTPGRGRGRPRKDASASLSPAPEVLQQPAATPYQEDVWVQCDACQKWRRLPPSTELEDDVSWYCNMNPDTNYRSCEIPEENYDAAKEVVVASTDPYYANLIPKDAEALRRELLAKASQLQTEAKVEAQAEQRRRKQTADKNATVFATVKDELQALVKACQQIINNAGSWMPPTATSLPAQQEQQQQQQQLEQQQGAAGLPRWVWSGLQHFAPKPAQVAAHADEVLAAMECFAPGAQQAAIAAAAASSIRVEAGEASRPKAEGRVSQPPLATASTPSTLANAASTSATPTANTSHMSEQQLEQQRQRQLQQIEAAQVHARMALLVAASVALPSAVEAQSAPEALVLPSSTSNKSGKGKQQHRGRGNGNAWNGALAAYSNSTNNNMFALPGMMPSFPLPAGFLSNGQDNPFAGLLGALQSPPMQGQQPQQHLLPPDWTAAFMGMGAFPPFFGHGVGAPQIPHLPIDTATQQPNSFMNMLQLPQQPQQQQPHEGVNGNVPSAHVHTQQLQEPQPQPDGPEQSSGGAQVLQPP